MLKHELLKVVKKGNHQDNDIIFNDLVIESAIDITGFTDVTLSCDLYHFEQVKIRR